jgi:hypothetical protein
MVEEERLRLVHNLLFTTLNGTHYPRTHFRTWQCAALIIDFNVCDNSFKKQQVIQVHFRASEHLLA